MSKAELFDGIIFAHSHFVGDDCQQFIESIGLFPYRLRSHFGLIAAHKAGIVVVGVEGGAKDVLPAYPCKIFSYLV